MLEKLIGVEKNAAAVIAEAEAEVGRMTAQARIDAQRESAELIKQRAAEASRAVEAEKKSLEEKRARAIEEYRRSLTGRSADKQAFRRTALSFIDQGKK